MASVSVVGQQPGPHRLDSEPPMLLFKLSGTKAKISLPRKSSWEKMMFARSCEDFGSVTAAEESRPPPEPAGGAAVGGGRMPGEGCGVRAAGSDAPRSPTQQGGGGVAGSPQGRAGRLGINREANQNTGSRRGGSLKESGLGAMPSGPTDGRRRSHRHRDSRLGRRGSRNGGAGPQSASSPGECGGLPLERLTQGRTGVVKLARTEPHRIEAWSIFPQEMDPRVRTERGEGHRFETQPVNQDWCDVCSREISAQVVKCQNCSYSCHLECATHIQLDCNQRDRKPQESPHPRSHCSSTPPRHKQSKTKEEEEGSTKNLSEEEVQAKIEEYNTQVSENGMKLAADGSYTGFIKVHLRLSRPVTVPAVKAQSSEGNHNPSEDQDETDCGYAEKRTSFYLPCDCVKQLHISSLTTTREVIQGLLKKFMVLDNPRKFALYRQTHRDSQDLFQKLPLSERPLLLRLIAGPDTEQLTFVLKENETGEVEWHAFSVPELQNFLVILEKEEAERVRAVQQKYTIYKQKLQQALQQHDP
ncbi:ras association domain-containing protein 5 isoform X1 [Nematolebias whitei]|uniref:ras association domain-containing protein 5 isoform X1 n=1 Tax=Nematolebias whitei TaxID=451745 RepID=UPI00189A313E|nr:ras association domain-containing protein 5 isoform X1 [Nematolebias whitei]